MDVLDAVAVPHHLAPESRDWQALCSIQKAVQPEGYGCGVACLAMVAGLDYEQAWRIFYRNGLDARRKQRPPLSTCHSELSGVITAAGLVNEQRRWTGWRDFNGLGIFKMKDDWRGDGFKKKWHWVVAFRHPVYEVVIFDPHQPAPAFTKMPMDVECTAFSLYQPKGLWLQVEQLQPLHRQPAQAAQGTSE